MTAVGTTRGDSLPPSLPLWRAALAVAFFTTGLSMATWVSRTPAIRDILHATTGEMGLIIAGLSVGSVVGIAAGGVLTSRVGARFVVACGMFSIVLGLIVVTLGALSTIGAIVALGLAFFGYGMGSGEIGLNVEGVELERRYGRSIIPGLHGGYSLGTFVGGLVGLAANATHLPILTHLAVVAAITAVGTLWLALHLPALTGANRAASVVDVEQPKSSIWRRPPWLDARLWSLAVIILGMALAEGSANDWLPLITVDGFGLTAAAGSVAYALFGLSMAVGRLSGGMIIDRFGRAPVMRVSALTAAGGIALVSFGPALWFAGVGVVLWGLGTSLGFPVALSAAGDDPRYAAKRASAVATAGYFSFLVGPLILGFLGQHIGLRAAIMVVMVVVLVTTFFVDAVRNSSPTRPNAAPQPVKDLN